MDLIRPSCFTLVIKLKEKEREKWRSVALFVPSYARRWPGRCIPNADSRQNTLLKYPSEPGTLLSAETFQLLSFHPLEEIY